MIHAELHGKFALEALELERSEDILTSTVFGTLLQPHAVRTLLEWLGDTTIEGGLGNTSGTIDYEFWPRMGRCEPDLILRVGSHLILIEVKYRSGASDGNEEQEDRADLQLVRESDALQRLSGLPGRAPEEPVDTRTLLYIVPARKRRAALEDIEAARRLRPGIRIGMVLWQDLYAILQREAHTGVFNGHRWKRELWELLRRRQLGTFSGFEYPVSNAVPQSGKRLRSWRHYTRLPRTALEQLDRTRLRRFAAVLQERRRCR